MSQDLEHGKFCPYCGKPLTDRSKFCPHCGKASPRAQRSASGSIATTTLVAVPPSTTPLSPGDAPAAQAPEAKQAGSQSSGPNGAPLVTVRSPEAPPVTVIPRRYAPPTHSLIGMFEQAGFGLRYGAWMFDFLITLIGMMIFTFATTALSHRSVVGSNRDLVIVAVLTVLLVVLNFVLLAGANGQTAGMRILGIYIMRIGGEPFTKKEAALRHLVGYPLSMAFFFLGFLWMLWDPRQQGWHDKLVGTIVVMSRTDR